MNNIQKPQKWSPRSFGVRVYSLHFQQHGKVLEDKTGLSMDFFEKAQAFSNRQNPPAISDTLLAFEMEQPLALQPKKFFWNHMGSDRW